MARVFLACPTHDGRVHGGCAKVLYSNASQNHAVEAFVASFSLLTANCNILWAMAINRFEAQQADWFAMIHSDVEPELFWIDKLIAEADRFGADIMSAVIPIKNEKGVTSTAIGHGDDIGSFFRITMSQVWHPSFPATFDCDSAVTALRSLPAGLRVETPVPANLLCNTGLIVCRLGPWCDPSRVYFDEVTTFRRIDNQWRPFIRSEDWFFTANAAKQGAKLMATKTLRVLHHGITIFPNDQVWGMPLEVEGFSKWESAS